MSPQAPAAQSQRRDVVAPKKKMWDDLVGSTIADRYEIRSVLGQGGMGTVFEGYHQDLDRRVAIKVLNPTQAAKKSAVQRFHNEARSSGMIGHPNICEVYDLGTLPGGSPYLVMEFLRGETLAARIARDRGMPLLDALDALAAVLAGLSAAHAKGIVHRDIKPENIMLLSAPAPGVKILDFGVSKMTGPDPYGEGEDVLSLTRTGMVMGTPYYMSAEQARGERDLDARVDVYACGVMLYEALAGRRPYIAPNYNALLLQIVGGPPTPLLSLKPELPPRVGEIVLRAMERDRRKRFQSAQEFRNEIVALRTDVGSRARPHTSKRAAPAPVEVNPSKGRDVPTRPESRRVSPPEAPAAPAPPARVEVMEFDDAPTEVFRPHEERAPVPRTAHSPSNIPTQRPAAGVPARAPAPAAQLAPSAPPPFPAPRPAAGVPAAPPAKPSAPPRPQAVASRSQRPPAPVTTKPSAPPLAVPRTGAPPAGARGTSSPPAAPLVDASDWDNMTIVDPAPYAGAHAGHAGPSAIPSTEPLRDAPNRPHAPNMPTKTDATDRMDRSAFPAPPRRGR